MNIVTCYEAAKIAKVSKQIMSTRKKVNAGDKSKYKYFAFDSETGDFGVDLDHNDWKRYMTKRRSTPAFKDQQSNSTKSQSTDLIDDNLVNKDKFAMAVRDACMEMLGMSKPEFRKLADLIERKYEQ